LGGWLRNNNFGVCLEPEESSFELDHTTVYHSDCMASTNGSQTLLIDADDTLWENNIYFERAIAAFISYLNHSQYTPDDVREVLYEVERESVLAHGYGLNSFAHSLAETFERLSKEPITPELHARIDSFCHGIASHPVEILSGVPETLAYLHQRHHLIVLTKGAVTEQRGKVERSGLKDYFAAIEIVPEKDTAVYSSLVAKYDLPDDRTWMVGNSPKSDINPALAAGINAVFVPHGNTWVLEHATVDKPKPPSKLLVVESFAKLRDHF
jgi:putative hydrolase of the HAD superfamily